MTEEGWVQLYKHKAGCAREEVALRPKKPRQAFLRSPSATRQSPVQKTN